NYDSLPLTIIGAKNLEQLFNVDYNTWQTLFDKSVENELKKGYTNKLIKEFLETKISETRPPYPKPSYIIGEPILTHDALIQSIKVFTTYNLEVLEEKRLEMNYDDTLFRILGPANTAVSEALASDNDICRIYGGCRMFTCIEYETQRVNDESIDEDDVY